MQTKYQLRGPKKRAGPVFLYLLFEILLKWALGRFSPYVPMSVCVSPWYNFLLERDGDF